MSWFSIQTSFVIVLFTFVHCVYVYRIMDGGCSTSVPFQLRHLSEHWITSRCVKILVCFWHKGLKRCRIDCFVWQFTTTITHHYMDTLEIKKLGFIKNKVVEAIVTWSVEKVALILLTHVYQSTLKSDGAWGIANTFPTSLMWWSSDSPKYLVAHVNGRCEGTCVNTKFWWFSRA